VGGSGITVHSFEFSCQNKLPPKVINFLLTYHNIEMSFCKVSKRNIP